MLERFKIYPEWGKLYYEVYVYDTHKGMNEHALDFKDWYPDVNGLDNAGALTIPFTVFKQKPDGSQGGMSPMIGQLLFCREPRFDEVVIAHECLHALVFYSLRKGMDIEKVFLGQEAEGEMSKLLGGIPGNRKVSKTIPDEILAYEHERFCMCHTFMMEQIIDKLKRKL